MADYLDEDRPPRCELHDVPMIRGRSVLPDGTPGPWEWLCAATAGDPASIAADPARDRRRGIWADRERRRAARALDRYLDAATEPAGRTPRGAVVDAAGERFVEAVGDYVLSRLHHKSHFHDAVCTGPGIPPGFTCDHPSHHNADCRRSGAHSPEDPALVEDAYDRSAGTDQ